MDERVNQLIHELVVQFLQGNQEFLAQEIVRDVRWEKGWQQAVSKAAMNAAVASTELSVQFIINFLIQTGGYSISEEALRPKLSVIRGGSNPKASQKAPLKEPPEQ